MVFTKIKVIFLELCDGMIQIVIFWRGEHFHGVLFRLTKRIYKKDFTDLMPHKKKFDKNDGSFVIINN